MDAIPLLSIEFLTAKEAPFLMCLDELSYYFEAASTSMNSFAGQAGSVGFPRIIPKSITDPF